MKLKFQRYGESGPPVLILHGLFGSLSNWGSISKQLAADFSVIGVDLRNHGGSGHSDEMDFPSMANDVLQLMDELGLESCSIVGHSMGGKVAMELALSQPQRLDRLAVVDIAPVNYQGGGDSHLEIIAAMEELPLQSIQSRADADTQLAKRIGDNAVRQFILTNLARNDDGGYRWRLNLAAIKHHYDKLRQEPSTSGPFNGPVLFIKGEMSNYVQPAHQATIEKLFPAAKIETVTGAGHWVHAEKPQVLLQLLLDFLKDS